METPAAVQPGAGQPLVTIDTQLRLEDLVLNLVRSTTVLHDLVRITAAIVLGAVGVAVPSVVIVALMWDVSGSLVTMSVAGVPPRVQIAFLLGKGVAVSGAMGLMWGAIRAALGLLEPLWWRLEARRAGVPNHPLDGFLRWVAERFTRRKDPPEE